VHLLDAGIVDGTVLAFATAIRLFTNAGTN
jgi:hypothetical protein